MIRVSGLHKTYRDESCALEVLRDASVEVDTGAFVAIRGRSGSGKSTLINIIGGLDRDYTGDVQVNGALLRELSEPALATYRKQTVGFVFQSFHLLRHLTVLDNVSLPAAFDTAGTRREASAVQARARDLLELVDLADRSDALPTQLSGGQKQRVAIARALFNEPTMLVCDEPTGNLDAATAESILDVFERLNAELETTLLVVTHDPHVARRAHRQITVADGTIHEGHVHTPVTAPPETGVTASP